MKTLKGIGEDFARSITVTPPPSRDVMVATMKARYERLASERGLELVEFEVVDEPERPWELNVNVAVRPIRPSVYVSLCGTFAPPWEDGAAMGTSGWQGYGR